MRRGSLLAATICLAAIGSAQNQWFDSLDSGVEEASKAGRAIFLVTMWKQTV